MTKSFGTLPNGRQATLYTISCGKITVKVTDFGATLVSALVPDRNGVVADVILGYDDANGYLTSDGYLGATVGRNANRIGGSAFELNGKTVKLPPNEKGNNLHSGVDSFHLRLWDVEFYADNVIVFRLESPDGDQGFPGKAVIRVTYELDPMGALHISYDGDCDQDTVFNMTNHSYFNLAGHDHPELAMDQVLTIPGGFFCPDDDENIPTGEERDVEGTPFDFRKPKAIGRDSNTDYEPLHLQGGYDHNFQVYSNPAAILESPDGGRSMYVYTDLPGIQFYSGNYLTERQGKDGVTYKLRGGICLETQYFPNALNHPEWVQPFTKAGERWHSETIYRFTW